MSDHLRDEHYRKIAGLMEAHTGIRLPPAKRAMIEGRLRKRMRIHDVASLEDYGALLFDHGRLDSEFSALVDCVTTNKTDFFREPDHFDFLRDQAVPSLLGARSKSDDHLKIWSAASSIGAEAYTMAMVLADLQARGGRFRFSVLGTDISSEVIQQARRAIYPVSMIEPIPEPFRRRYVMMAVNASRHEMRIVPELRARAHFERLNLLDPSYPFDSDVDVIFCRNILIYFSKETQQAVIGGLCDHLRPGGFLILGHSESFALDDKSLMRQVAPTVFQRIAARSTKERAA